MRKGLALLLPFLPLIVAPAAFAGAPADLLGAYEAQARREDPAFAGFAPERGAELYRRSVAAGGGAASCAGCHSPDPRQPGRHARTGKVIAPLAPAVNPDRLADPAKAEKWFGRNCRDVLARECTAREKGDFVRYLMNAK
jgi:hypothetical protein